MQDKFEAVNSLDEEGNPTGGSVSGVGLSITWQNGSLGRDEARQEPNGAFVETVIAAAANRLEFYQSTRFRCDENQDALDHLNTALRQLQERTAAREERKVEGTHEV